MTPILAGYTNFVLALEQFHPVYPVTPQYILRGVILSERPALGRERRISRAGCPYFPSNTTTARQILRSLRCAPVAQDDATKVAGLSCNAADVEGRAGSLLVHRRGCKLFLQQRVHLHVAKLSPDLGILAQGPFELPSG